MRENNNVLVQVCHQTCIVNPEFTRQRILLHQAWHQVILIVSGVTRLERSDARNSYLEAPFIRQMLMLFVSND